MKKTHKNTNLGMALGMCLGLSLGSAFGQLLFQNMAIGISMGLCLGMCLGMVIGAAKDKAVNQQLEEQGYTILNIEQAKDSKAYAITLVNKAGETQVLTVSAGEVAAEDFSTGDLVYLDEDGDLEQAFDKEDADP